MRIDLEVLNSFDLIITTSMMQSVDESVSVCVTSQCQGAIFDMVGETDRQAADQELSGVLRTLNHDSSTLETESIRLRNLDSSRRCILVGLGSCDWHECLVQVTPLCRNRE